MRRPFTSLCIFLLIGILTGHFTGFYVPLKYMGYLLVLLVWFSFFEKRFILALAFVVILLGNYIYGESVKGSPLLSLVSGDTKLIARVLKEGASRRGFKEYHMEIRALILEGSPRLIRVNEKAKLNLWNGTNYESMPGINDIIEIQRFQMKPLAHIENNSLDPYDLYLRSQGMAYVVDGKLQDISIHKGDFSILDLSSSSYRAKIYVEDFLDATLDFENSNILKSIVFGNQGYLSKEDLDIFSKTGTAHIMAVSGLHVGLIVLILDGFLKLMKIGKNNRICLTILILIFYGYMVNFPISIIRAGAMYLLYVIAYFLGRRYDSINGLCFIAFVLLLYRPMVIFSISFQLSFTATLSILLLKPILDQIFTKKIGRGLGSLLSVTLAAQIGTLPIMAYQFKQISIISLVSNLLIVPLLTHILGVTFLSIILGTVSFKLGYLVNQITNQLLSYIRWISEKCAIIPYSSIEVEEFKLTYVIVYYVILGILYGLYYKHRSMKKQKVNLNKEGLVKMYEL